MFIFGLIVGVIAGAAGGWGLTYLWFKRDKVRAKIANEVNSVAGKITEGVNSVAGKIGG